MELHLHTRASFDSLVKTEKLLKHCDRIGIDRVAITDHNVIESALRAKTLAPDRVIVGEEIETTQGELIGYFLSEWVPPGLEPQDTIDRLRSQGAVISIPHPFDPMRNPNWTEEQLLAIAPLVDAVETFNARCWSNKPNLEAASYAQAHGLLETVGSDAHLLCEVGRASMMMQDFEDTEGFKAALKHAKPITNKSLVLVHLFSRMAMLLNRWK